VLGKNAIQHREFDPVIRVEVTSLLKLLLSECVATLQERRMQTMNKITPDHLSRSAYIYVRQSTPDQLINNSENRRRQYALTTRAQALGWENVVVIDDDLGRSGGGTGRPGFERLLTAICTGAAGAVFAIEASRLARNGRDWHTLLEFSTLVNSLIVDEDGVYDPRLIKDRLLLGMKGTFSELESLDLAAALPRSDAP
jgi:DNA invertase Pin-like site-specific DNA recombinase